MPEISATELKERLIRDLPGALAPERPKDQHAGNGHVAEASAKGKKEEGPVDLLATSDAVVLAERIPEVATYVRDTLGYELLSDLTAVDYLADGLIEVIYRFQHLDGGPTLPVKTRVSRDRAVVPSITPIWPGADLQEREAFDLYGVDFPGHPNLKRVYMWDEFEGFPMRKDFPKQGDKYLGDGEE
ncbi:MAG TPA: NADH-quinone oxidoreductase subunit C [Kouleothrix sp.]|nr:NADH-quinone oxidoreductase subunit C [Kouleothrix sp.]